MFPFYKTKFEGNWFNEVLKKRVLKKNTQRIGYVFCLGGSFSRNFFNEI